ncbi:MAG TPA: thioesterase family protein [Burkholderiales bacterium]|nr:thioesterase family protein [Burkholderiales bacterium]
MTPQAPLRRLVHVESIPMRWGDMDAMGHVNNTVYFRYMEQARIAWFDALVPERETWSALGIVIVSTSCNFRKPMSYPGRVDVKLFAGAPGGSSVSTFYELSVGEELCADGVAVVVFIDLQSQKPVRIPERIRSLLQ